jgi:hypothetical protein
VRRKLLALTSNGYIVTPEHSYLLLSESRQRTPADALKSLKRGVSRRLDCRAEYSWQFQCPQMSVNSYQKLRHIHRNSAKCGRGREGRVNANGPRQMRKKVASRHCPSTSRLHSSQKTAMSGPPFDTRIYRVLTSTMEINRRQDRWAEFYLPENIWHPWPLGSSEMSMESE